MQRRIPELTSDEAAEAFLDQNVSGLDFSQFKPAKFTYPGHPERSEGPIPAVPLEP